MNKYWTDYPIVELGDIPNEEAPIREVHSIVLDFGYYAECVVEGLPQYIKLGYIYDSPRRFDDEMPQSIRQRDVRFLNIECLRLRAIELQEVSEAMIDNADAMLCEEMDRQYEEKEGCKDCYWDTKLMVKAALEAAIGR